MPQQFWKDRPISNIIGAEETVRAVIQRIQEAATRIRLNMPDIQALDVQVSWSNWHLSVPRHEGPADHLQIMLFRRFRNGHADAIGYHVFRTGEETFSFAYTGQ